MTDSFGYGASASHNYKYGTVETSTDENAQQIRTEVDSVGRVRRIVGPYELAENRTTISFEYHPEASVPYAVTRHIDKDERGNPRASGTLDTVLYTDGLKRVLQTKKDASLHGGGQSLPKSVMIVSGRVTFDAFGRTIDQYYPTTEPKGDNSAFNPSYDSVQATRMSYIKRGRSK